MSTDRTPRIVWITGASSGIGKALADTFARAGDYVVATSRSRAKLQTFEKRLKAPGRGGEVFQCDVRRESDVSRLVRSILRRHKRIDVLINNAGVTTFQDFVRTSVRVLDDILDTNLRGLFLTTRAVLPVMIKRKAGIIVNILSYAAKTTYTKSAAYSAAKAGAEALMNVLRAEVRGHGIKVINIYPGAVHTTMWPGKYRNRYGKEMMASTELASLVYQMTVQPKAVHIEELIVRPQRGDLQL